MSLIPSRHIYSIRDDRHRPDFFNSATAFRAPYHVLSPLGRKLRFISDTGLALAIMMLALEAAIRWIS